MGRYKGLRTRTTKNILNDLKQRVAAAYSHSHISRRRMDILLGKLDEFEAEAFITPRTNSKEIAEEATVESEDDFDELGEPEPAPTKKRLRVPQNQGGLTTTRPKRKVSGAKAGTNRTTSGS